MQAYLNCSAFSFLATVRYGQEWWAVILGFRHRWGRWWWTQWPDERSSHTYGRDASRRREKRRAGRWDQYSERGARALIAGVEHSQHRVWWEWSVNNAERWTEPFDIVGLTCDIPLRFLLRLLVFVSFLFFHSFYFQNQTCNCFSWPSGKRPFVVSRSIPSARLLLSVDLSRSMRAKRTVFNWS